MEEARVQDAEAVALEVRTTGVVGQLTVSSPAGTTVGVKDAFPAKSKVLFSETGMALPKAPALRLTVVAEIVKSPT